MAKRSIYLPPEVYDWIDSVAEVQRVGTHMYICDHPLLRVSDAVGNMGDLTKERRDQIRKSADKLVSVVSPKVFVQVHHDIMCCLMELDSRDSECASLCEKNQELFDRIKELEAKYEPEEDGPWDELDYSFTEDELATKFQVPNNGPYIESRWLEQKVIDKINDLIDKKLEPVLKRLDDLEDRPITHVGLDDITLD